MTELKVGDSVRVIKATERISSSGEPSLPDDHDYKDSLDLTGMIATVVDTPGFGEFQCQVFNAEMAFVSEYISGWWVEEVELLGNETISKAELYDFLKASPYEVAENLRDSLINAFGLAPKPKKATITLELEINEELFDYKDLTSFLSDVAGYAAAAEGVTVTNKLIEEN